MKASPRSRIAHLKDELMPKYASLIYNGFGGVPRNAQVAIDHTQQQNGDVIKLKEMWKLWGGEARTPFDEKIATFEEDDGAYNQADAEGFIKLSAEA